ncbi:hypothetical protein CE91St56_51090 [Lachnospiraceae bacterium]|nr:hypothetical protein CE91St56_51090 [Lachnospiraceae bacterium]GKH44062.1 hypothetical protein CE91St57_50360 [Lachnospiraceae bacterium]
MPPCCPQSDVPGTEKDIRQSIRPDIPMSPKASSVSDEADALDRSHLHGLKGSGEHSFSVPGTSLCGQQGGKGKDALLRTGK